MKTFVLAITTCNRITYLKKCIESWEKTKSSNYNWVLIVADDQSNDGTLIYLEQLNIPNTEVIILSNSKFGVHQQVNTIFKKLESILFDICFKIDDDIVFLKKGWDLLYSSIIKDSGNDHLVFCDTDWCSEQHLEEPLIKDNLIGRVPLLHSHGFFYTITPEVLKKVGYMDVDAFGFRGMGHVDYTMRCARMGFTNKTAPWDVLHSNEYISATKENYKSVIPSELISVYDTYYRKKKEEKILKHERSFIASSEINTTLFNSFQRDLILALTDKVKTFEDLKENDGIS
jgi:glycosyltransferase involved in cell wall biosynthesis